MTLSESQQTLIFKLMNSNYWTALLFLKSLQKMHYGLCDKSFFENQFSNLCKIQPSFGKLEPLTQDDFENWEEIEREYIHEFVTETEMVFCPLCRDFIHEPCVHLEFFWQSIDGWD